MKRSPPRFRVLTAALALALSSTAAALSTDKNQLADIQSRSVDADERTNIAIYQDNVRYTQGTRRIESSRLEVVMKNDEVTRAKAAGRPVKLRVRPDNSQHDVHASGERLEYRGVSDELEMFDSVTLRHQPDNRTAETHASGDRLLYRGSEDIAELFGRVIVRQGSDVVRGSYANVNLKTDRVIVRGDTHADERIHAVIQPRKKTGDAMDGGGRVTPGAVTGTAAGGNP